MKTEPTDSASRPLTPELPMSRSTIEFLFGVNWRERSWRLALFYGVVVIVGVLLLLTCRAFFHDDSYITLRYAANWLAGHGPVWNAGERVEGFTHPLWLFQATGLGAIGLDLVTAARVLGYFYLGCLVTIWLPARGAPILLLPLITLHGLVLWAGGGLEVTGFSFLLVLTAWQTNRAWEAGAKGQFELRASLLAGLAAALSALLRPEGFGVGIIVLLWLAMTRERRTVLSAGLAFALPLAAYLVFRLLYYGDILPNTAYAKIAGLPPWEQVGLGIKYLLRVRGEWVPAMALALVCMWRMPTSGALRICTLSIPVWGGLLLGGGDHMPGARLVLPALVLCLYGAAYAARQSASRGTMLRWVVPACVILAIWQATPLVVLETWGDPAAEGGKTTGRVLEQTLQDGALIAAATAGSTPYYAQSLLFIDTLGLNDSVIARREVELGVTRWQGVPGHRKGFGSYVLDRRPDVIVLGPSNGYLGEDFRRWFLGDYELMMDSRFYREYSPYHVKVMLQSPKLNRSRAVGRIFHLRNDSPHVTKLRNIGSPLRHPYSGPPDPASISSDTLEPVDWAPEEVPLLRPVLVLFEREEDLVLGVSGR